MPKRTHRVSWDLELIENGRRLEEWLSEHGGPSVRLRLAGIAGKAYGGAEDRENLARVLGLPEVEGLLRNLDAFRTAPRDKKSLEHLIHYYKDTCIDQCFPRLMDLGFRAGMEIFDERMAALRELYPYLLAEHYGYSLMVSRFFLMAGYAYPELVDAVKRRIALVHAAAAEGVFDIFQDKGKLPKPPKVWADKGVIKDELNPWSTSMPLPTIYDIAAMAYLPARSLDAETGTRIHDIIAYILRPEFQELPEGYGLLWVKSRRIYHSCGWSPTLPLYPGSHRLAQYDRYQLLPYLEIMCRFSVARRSRWFADCFASLEAYRTERGTYLFPKEVLNRKYVAEAFLNDSGFALGRKDREEMTREIASTLYMVSIVRQAEGDEA